MSKRCYLTESYKLDQAWAERLQSPILAKVDIENLYVDIDSKYTQQRKISPVDVDIYANKITDDKHMDEIVDLMQKLRSTSEASNVFDSSQHAVIRNYIDNNNFDSLVHVLNHRSEYGVFLDNHSANILLDKMIQTKNFKLGARFATLIALQEDFSNPITTYMSLYNCYKFLDNLEEFEDLIVKPVEEVVDVAAPKSKKKKEEVRIRVNYLKNPFYDDHFDIIKSNHLLGKTFLYLADEVDLTNKTLVNSLKLVGYALYEKFDDGNKFLAQAKADPFFKETVDAAKSLAEKVENLVENEAAKKFFETIDSVSVKEEKADVMIEKLVKQAVDVQAAKDIEEQKQNYAKWNADREQKLNDEIYRMNRIQRLYNVEKVQADLQVEEKKLWFFENADKIELEIDSKKVFYPKRWYGKKKKPRVIDENYVPPDVDQRRNVK